MEERLIGKMVDAMHIGSDDVVMVNYWCDSEKPDFTAFTKALAQRGIRCHATVFSDEYLTGLTAEYKDGLDDAWFAEYADTTVVIDVMDKPAGMPPADMGAENIEAFGAVLQSLFGFMVRHGKLIQITMPSIYNAALAGEDFETYERRLTQALDIDYEALDARCREKANSLSCGKIRIRTGSACELTMNLTGREWIVDAGEGAFPCGEVYIAPLEDETNGNLYFAKFPLEGVGVFTDVTLTVENGRVTGSDCEAFNAFLKGQEDGASVVAELGIGMNPAVTCSGTGASLDEDAEGTFHIGLGMNVMFGGTNACRFHMDFVTEGEITGDEK